MKILVTGADGFVGRNLAVRLAELDGFEVLPFTRGTDAQDLRALVGQTDRIVHLAGENRPDDPAQFDVVNTGLTRDVAETAAARESRPPILFASSIQAEWDNPYGRSKKAGEAALEVYGEGGGHAAIYRLPNIFGKWCRPNYNSVVATFAHNAAHGLDLPVNDPDAALKLVYIDDVVDEILGWIGRADHPGGVHRPQVSPVYETTVGFVADRMRAYAAIPDTLTLDAVGTGLSRALYATYVSYLPPEKAAYDLTVHADPRGRFAEMLRTEGSGQVSFFTADPGVTRGGHYHHTKTEKFLVVAGSALFRFRHVVTGETFELATSAKHPQVVDTIPGWVHDITNTGEDEMIVVLWANELFEPERPDTVARSLEAEAS
ncbi:MAG: NAD-dependent epimerase/dehydratase family protein [Erythrobacter sp.]|uniref:polysaccharide biosynthesis C-terminal domain-containing protein n=1 Tax=Erythrobacter sp. TaxID=1042 RepID=UPI003C721026